MLFFYTNKTLLPDSMKKDTENVTTLVQILGTIKKAAYGKEVRPNTLPFEEF